MPTIDILTPTDQPTNNRRLLTDLKRNLTSGDYRLFALAVAFAKTGPMYRLLPDITTWRRRGGRTLAIFGINERGTSYQALDFALRKFDRVYITFHPKSSFHPKCYYFIGASQACVFIGSNNLTVGGTELNFESGVYFGYELPSERESLLSTWGVWSQLMPHRCSATVRLTRAVLEDLSDHDLLLDEEVSSGGHVFGDFGKSRWKPPVTLSNMLPWVPPSQVPGGLFKKKSAKNSRSKKESSAQSVSLGTVPYAAAVTSLAIQLRPHDNGEIFLSKIAIKQNPGFFGFPFSEWTTPKKAGGTPYPQRLPDPRVDIYVYGSAGIQHLQLIDYGLNTVYYKQKEEIRITARPIVEVTPEYSIMLMHKQPPGSGRDYVIEIHRPDSPDYAVWLSCCDQKMPGGGKGSRYFGWI